MVRRINENAMAAGTGGGKTIIYYIKEQEEGDEKPHPFFDGGEQV